MTHDSSHDLTGKIAVVTGASSGIGRAIALRLAASGAHVLVHARQNREGAEAVARQVRAREQDAKVVLCDLADPGSHQPLVDQAWSWRGSVDIWVNNAGVDVLTGEAAEWSFSRKLEALWNVDVCATIALSRAIGAKMKARGTGAIINIGWDGVDHGMEGNSAQLFAASKGAVTAFSRNLAHTLAPAVRVNCIAPGWIKTNWGEHASHSWQERVKEDSLMDRWGTPEDVAAVAAFLASPAASFTNGIVIEVNGGHR